MRAPALFALLLLLPVACQLVVDEEELAWNGAADGGLEPDGAIAGDAGNPPDAGPETDAGLATDAGEGDDAGELPDAGLETDAGELPDAGGCSADCGSLHCEPLSDECVECLEDSHCGAARFCHAQGRPFQCGLRWTEVGSGDSPKLNAVWVAEDGTAWAVGDQAAIRRCTPAGCGTVTVANMGSATPSWNAVAGDEQAIWIVGSGGAVATCDPSCSLLTGTGLTMTLSSVLVLPGDVWATGATGSIYMQSSNWASGHSSQKWLHAIDEADGVILAGGADGMVVRCTADSCGQSTLSASEDYFGVAGAGSHWWLAGTLNNAGVLRVSDAAGSYWSAPLPQGEQLTAVAAALTPEPTAWLAGRAGVWRADTQGNVILEHTVLVGGLNGISASSDGRHVWAVGEIPTGGLVYVR